jgi:tubulin--tyrosine ligase
VSWRKHSKLLWRCPSTSRWDLFISASGLTLTQPQPLPNAFELYGIDFLVSHGTGDSPFKVQLLEVNAEPAIELTGPRLTWILEDLFVAMGRICVQPFLDVDTVIKEEELAVRRVLDIEVRGSGGW